MRVAAARHGRGHVVHAVRPDPRLRRGGRAAGRRLHQARQGQVRGLGEVGDHPQDGRGDVAGHPGAGDQARRPAAQHAHAALPAARQAAPDRLGDAGDLRSAGPPAGHERDQVGAGGPVLRGHAAEGVRRDRPDGGRGGAPPGRVPLPGDRAGDRRPAVGQDQGGRHRSAEALLLDLPEDGRPRPRLRRHLRPGRSAGAGGDHHATATRRSG